MTKSKISIKHLTLMGLFTALIAVGAFIKVPISFVPVTLQTFFVSLAGLMLGKKYGALTLICYTVLGLIGLPIFTSGGGIGYIFVPTFGYVLGFIVGAFATGALVQNAKPSFWRYFLASLVGLFCVYAIGLVYLYAMRNFYLGEPMGVYTLLLNGFLLTVPGDIVFSAVAAFVALRLTPVINRVA